MTRLRLGRLVVVLAAGLFLLGCASRGVLGEGEITRGHEGDRAMCRDYPESVLCQ